MPGKYQYDIELKTNVAKLLTDMKEVQDRLDTVEGKEYKIKLNVDEKKLLNIISNLEKMLASLGKGTGNFKQFENLSKELSSIVSEVQNLSKAFGKVDDSGTKTLLSSIQNIDKSLSELSQHILNVNKNMSNIGGDTNGAVKQAENISNAYDNAAKSAERLANAQSKIGNKSNISSENVQQEKSQQTIINAMAKVREHTVIARREEEKRQRLAQNNAINKALEQEYQERQKNIQAAEKQAELDKQKALAFTKSASDKLSSAISKYSYGNSSDATAMMKQMNRGLSNFGDLSNVKGNITQLSSIIDKIIADLKVSHEQSLSALNEEIKSEQKLQAQKDAFHKKNISAIDLEIQKREEEAKSFSRSLKAQMEERQKQLSSMESTIKGYYKDYNNRNIKPTSENRSIEYQQALDKYLASIKELEAEKDRLSKLDSINEEELSHYKKLRDLVQENANAFKAMSSAQKGSDALSRGKEIDTITKYLDKFTGISKQAKRELNGLLDQLQSGDPSVNVKKIHERFLELTAAERMAGREARNLFDIFNDKKIYSFIGQAASMFSFYDLINLGRQSFETIRGIDTALVDLKKTTAMNSSQLEEFYYDSNDVAKQMGVTTQAIIEQASAWSRLGYNTKESSTQMAELSSQFAAISPDMDLDTATDGLVSSMKAFDIEVSNVERDIMDNINRIGNTAATSNGEIVDMLTRSSAAMAAANNTIQETIALETAAVEITRNAETTGTAFKTLSMRIRGYDEETEELSDDLKNISGDIADLTKTASTPGGISLFTDETKQTYKSTYQILKEISDIYDELSDKNRAELLEKLAGKRGGQVVAGLLSNFDAAEKALREMEGAAGSADAEMSIVEESIDFKLNKLQQTWVGTIQNIVDRGDLGTAIDGLTKLSEAIGWVVDKAGLLGTIGLGAGLFAGFKNIGRPKMFGLYKYADINMCSLGY